MSIASEITRIKGKVADSFTACVAKGATIPESEVIANLPTCIDSIPTGSSAVLGTKSITANGTYNAVDDSLDGYSAVTVDVAGGEPEPTDGKTHAYITVTPITGLAVSLYIINGSTGTLYVDWGDNTTQFTSTTSGNISAPHTYTDYANYDITVWKNEGTLFLGHSDYNNRNFVGGYNLTQRNMLRRIFVGNNCITMRAYGFQNCNSLREVIMSDAVQNIQSSVFKNSIAITSYTIYHSSANLYAIDAFTGINPICKIYVPDALVDSYKVATNWVTYADYIYPISERV